MSTAQPSLRVIRGTTRLDLGELVDGVDALQAEVVGGDVGDHRDVVAGQADALEQDAAAGGLGDRELDLRVREHPAGAARAGVVAGLDQLAVDVDAVGVGPADELARRCGRCGRSSGEVVVLPLVPVTATTGTCGVIVRRRGSPGSAARDLARRPRSRPPRRRPSGSASSTVGDGPAHHLGAARGARHGKATTIWCGSLVGRTRTASRAVPDSRGDRPHQPPDRAQREPLPEARVRRARAGRSAARSGAANRSAVSSDASRQRADVEGQLDRGAREVEVRALEDPQLDE